MSLPGGLSGGLAAGLGRLGGGVRPAPPGPPPAMVATIADDPATQTVSVTVENGTPPYTYLWGDGSTADTLEYTFRTQGPYTATVTVTDSAANSDGDSKAVTRKLSPAVLAGLGEDTLVPLYPSSFTLEGTTVTADAISVPAGAYRAVLLVHPGDEAVRTVRARVQVFDGSWATVSTVSVQYDGAGNGQSLANEAAAVVTGSGDNVRVLLDGTGGTVDVQATVLLVPTAVGVPRTRFTTGAIFFTPEIAPTALGATAVSGFGSSTVKAVLWPGVLRGARVDLDVQGFNGSWTTLATIGSTTDGDVRTTLVDATGYTVIRGLLYSDEDFLAECGFGFFGQWP